MKNLKTQSGCIQILRFGSQKYGTQTAAITYDGDKWNLNGSLSYLENETLTVSAIYAPCYEVTGNTMSMKTGMQLGMTEYFEAANCTLENGIISISFEDVTRDYSRLRIVGVAGQTYTVATTDFTTPAGIIPEATEPYTLTADDKGNAYLYGTFAEGATVTVKQGDFSFADYTFTEATEATYSYALEARPVVGVELETVVTEDDITALVDEIKSFVDNGITTIVVTGSEPAIIDMDSYTITAIGEAIYRLSGSFYSADNPYNGKIDLILPDVTVIVDQEFYGAFALNSINLPKVTTVGDGAFYDCWYLEELTFGSVVTSINQSRSVVFHRIAEKVDGGLCNLVLNSKQVNAEADYQPNTETNTLWDTEWKSITLK